MFKLLQMNLDHMNLNVSPKSLFIHALALIPKECMLKLKNTFRLHRSMENYTMMGMPSVLKTGH